MCVRLSVHIENVGRSMAYKGRTSCGRRDTVRACDGARVGTPLFETRWGLRDCLLRGVLTRGL